MKADELIIVGGSAAGLTAALFAARRGIKTTVITKDLGGQLASTLDIANYPGIPFIEGYSLAEILAEQARRAGANIVFDEISSLNTQANEQVMFVAKGNREYWGKAMILALGKTPRGLGLPREKELLGRGVGYCAPSDIRTSAGQRVVIVGGGGTAFAAAKLGASIAEKITLVHRNDTFRAEKMVVEEVRSLKNVEIMTNTIVTELIGTEKLTDVEILTDSVTRVINCDLLLIGAGFTVNPDLYSHLVNTNDLGLITVNERQETSRPGLFAAGDITSVPFNQAVISAGEGAKAALSAYSWLTGKPVGADWG